MRKKSKKEILSQYLKIHRLVNFWAGMSLCDEGIHEGVSHILGDRYANLENIIINW